MSERQNKPLMAQIAFSEWLDMKEQLRRATHELTVARQEYAQLQVVLRATQKALREMQAERDKAREGKS